FVTLAAAAVHGTSGVIAKLLALPVFCIVIVLARLLHHALTRTGAPVFRTMIALKVVLLAAAATAAVTHGPFPDSDAPWAVATGLLLVAAMAIQNAVHRVHLGKFPPSTLMTGNSTQIMLDLADKLVGVQPAERAAVHARLRGMSAALVAFAIGCALAAAGY